MNTQALRRIMATGTVAQWGVVNDFLYIFYRGALLMVVPKVRIEDEPLDWLAAEMEAQCHIYDSARELEHWMKEFFK